MIIGLSLIFIFRWQINLLTLDEEEAKSLGINVRKYRLIFIVASTLLSAAAVCLGDYMQKRLLTLNYLIWE